MLRKRSGRLAVTDVMVSLLFGSEKDNGYFQERENRELAAICTVDVLAGIRLSKVDCELLGLRTLLSFPIPF